MKFIPDAIGRKLGEQGLLASEHAPKLLFVGGVVGMVGSTVLACNATLKLEAVLDEIESDKRAADRAKEYVDGHGGETPRGATLSDEEHRQIVRHITGKGVVAVTKLYAPAVLLGGVSIFALTKSHNILRDRNLALTAAYTAVSSAFENYRGRVIERFGEDVDQELQYESEQIDVVNEETGDIESRIAVTGGPGSAYFRFYDEYSSRNWSPDPNINVFFLRSVQNHCNDLLQRRGHVFLNEVYEALGLSHTPSGAVVGWRYNKGSGDDFIDFGFWDYATDTVKEFMNGREGAIGLDFNVDGLIYDKINPEEYR